MVTAKDTMRTTVAKTTTVASTFTPILSYDRDELHHWYAHRTSLPPGLAEKERLPPGWEKKVVVHRLMPVEYRTYVHPAPVELVRVLPPPPPDCQHVVRWPCGSDESKDVRGLGHVQT
jgi:hypothetical protein